MGSSYGPGRRRGGAGAARGGVASGVRGRGHLVRLISGGSAGGPNFTAIVIVLLGPSVSPCDEFIKPAGPS